MRLTGWYGCGRRKSRVCCLGICKRSEVRNRYPVPAAGAGFLFLGPMMIWCGSHVSEESHGAARTWRAGGVASRRNRSRFPSGMTERRARAKAKARAKQGRRRSRFPWGNDRKKVYASAREDGAPGCDPRPRHPCLRIETWGTQVWCSVREGRGLVHWLRLGNSFEMRGLLCIGRPGLE